MTDGELPARAWIEGYGSRVVPRPPYEIGRLRDGDRAVFAHHGAGGVRSIMIAPETGSLALGPGTSALGEVVAFLEEIDDTPGWQIVTGELQMAWPAGSSVWSTPYEAHWPFELTFGQGRDQVAYVEGPFDGGPDGPSLDDLVGEGMRVGERGTFAGRVGPCSWMDLHYGVEGVAWLQRRVLVPGIDGVVLLVTAQSPAEHAPFVLEAGSQLAATLTIRSD